MPLPYQTDQDIDEIRRRVNNDEERIQRYLSVRRFIIGELKGAFYDLDGSAKVDFNLGGERGRPDNFALEFMSNIMPDIAFSLPRVHVTTAKEGLAYYGAKSLNHGMNRILHESNYTRLARRSGADYCVGYSVLWRGLGPKPGLSPDDDPIDWPFCDRLNPNLFGFDSSADTWEEREYAWHDTIEYKDDLLKMAREGPSSWHLDVIEDAPSGVGEDLKRKGSRYTDMKGKLIYRTLHLPKVDARPLVPKGEDATQYHGVLLTFIVESTDGRGMKPVRPPRAYRGCTEGPYELIGMNYIPDEALETTVLALVQEQQKEYADLVAANNQSARDYKKVMVAANKKLARIIEKAGHHKIFYLAGLQKDEIQTHEYGGVGPGQDYVEQRARDHRDRNVGMTDTERGALTGAATATENALANAAVTKRRGLQIATFHEGHERNIRAMAELAWINDTTIIDLGPDAAADLGPAAVFFGGSKPSPNRIRAYYKKNYPGVPIETLNLDQVQSESVPFADLELRIEMGSMGRKTDEQRFVETQAYMGMLQLVSQTLLQFPFIPVDKLKREVAMKLRAPEIVELIDDELVQLTRVMMLQAQVPPPEANGGEPQPRLLNAVAPSTAGPTVAQPQHMASGGPSATQTRGKAMVGTGT